MSFTNKTAIACSIGFALLALVLFWMFKSHLYETDHPASGTPGTPGTPGNPGTPAVPGTSKHPSSSMSLSMIGTAKRNVEADTAVIRFRVDGVAPLEENAELNFAQKVVDIGQSLSEKRITKDCVTRSSKRVYRNKLPSSAHNAIVKEETVHVVEQEFELKCPFATSPPPALLVETLTKSGAAVMEVTFPFSVEFRQQVENEVFAEAVVDAKAKAQRVVGPDFILKQTQVSPLQLHLDEPAKVATMDPKFSHLLAPPVLTVFAKVKVAFLASNEEH